MHGIELKNKRNRLLVDAIKENRYKILDIIEEVAREILESKNMTNRGWYNIYIYTNGEIERELEAQGGNYKEYKNKYNYSQYDSIKVFSIPSCINKAEVDKIPSEELDEHYTIIDCVIEDLLDKCKIELDIIIADLEKELN